MADNTKKMAPVIFAVAILSFFLPFAAVSCGDQKVVTLTGIALATGTTVKQPGMFGGTQAQKVNAELTALLALLAALFGFGLSFVTGKVPAIVRAVMGGFGALMLLALKGSLDGKVTRQAAGMIRVDYEFGFWFALLFMVGGAAFNGYLAAQKEMNGLVFVERKREFEEPTATAEVPPQPAAPPPATDSPAMGSATVESRFCSQCGTAIELGSKFCVECGASVS